ncbi:MAG: Uma2 family endonuclease [Cyanobacteria bacterium P01_F01_bin.33]
MVAIASPQSDIFYPTGDGEPVAETYAHFCAIVAIFEVLRQYLSGQQATVLANQFLYYVPNFPKLRVAPDVMVIFGVEPGGRDSYKIWVEGEVPAIIFEITSAGTRRQDFEEKRALYEGLGVSEYWLFDPRGEWIPEKLRGFRLQNESYTVISEPHSELLQLDFVVEDELLRFCRGDTGEKLPLPAELTAALQHAELQRQQAETARQQAENARQTAEAELDRYRKKFGALDS